jgi:hypothetical protein
MPHPAPTREPLDPPLAEPTDALPGTPEKLDVLRERYERGHCLWHPADRGPEPEASSPSSPKVWAFRSWR